MKIRKNCCHQSCSFWPRYAPYRFLASPQPPLGELTVLPRSPSGGRGRRDERGRERWGGNEMGSWTPQIFRRIDAFDRLAEIYPRTRKKIDTTSVHLVIDNKVRLITSFFILNKKLSYRWQTARCRFVKLRYCSTFFVRIRRQEVHQRLQCNSVPVYLQ